MKFAVIGDIHSNIAALKAVMNDINQHDLDFTICTGDLVGYAPFPNEVIDYIRQRQVICIQGNYDQAIGDYEGNCGCDDQEAKSLTLAGLSVRFTNAAISKTNRHYLKNLPELMTLKVGGKEILVVHGSPRRMNEYLFEDSLQVQEVTQELAADVLICGHTHKPYYQVINDKHVINSGSVGKPKHGNPNATYVIVTMKEDVVTVDILEVPYEYEQVAQAIEGDALLPNEFADLLRKG